MRVRMAPRTRGESEPAPRSLAGGRSGCHDGLGASRSAGHSGRMDNGHVYPSEYALRFSRRTGHPATYHAVVDELRRRFPTEWPYLLGMLFAHREACMVAALRALDRALGKPKVTRAGLRREMLAALAAITERGPEAVPPRS